MKSFTGYLKKKLGDSYVLLAGGDHKALSDFSMDGHNHNYILGKNFYDNTSVVGSGHHALPVDWKPSQIMNAVCGDNKSIPAVFAAFSEPTYWDSLFWTGYGKAGLTELRSQYNDPNTRLLYRVAYGYNADAWGNFYTIATTADLPTKASWNYDDVYVKSVSISGNYLRVNKNGTNTDLTIPYATNSTTAYTLLSNGTALNLDAAYDASPGLHFFKIDNTASSLTGEASGGGDGYILQWSWSLGSVGLLIYLDDNPTKVIRIRGCSGSSGKNPTGFTSWATILHSDNISPSLLISGNTIAVDVNGKTSSYITVPYATSAGSVAWDNVSSKPATATRWPSWSEVTNKPDSFNPSSHTHNYIRHVGKTEDECIPEVSDSFQSFRCTSSTTGFGDGYIMAQRWSYGNFITQLYTEVDPSYALLYRYRDSGGTWGAWKRVPMGDGTGASGTWSINITGNADTVDNKHASDFATSEHNHDSSYIKSGGDDVRGNFTFRGRIFGYNYNNQGSNAAAFMLDKPGNYFTGIGPNGVSNQIHFGPCNTDGTWASGFSQQWEFQGNVYASNYYTTSDARKKQNIHKISDNIKQFEWKETGETSYGFVAQDLEVKHPELVNDDGNMKTVNYNAALSLVVAKLENRVKELEAKLGIDTPPLYLTRTKIVRLPSFSINSDSSKTWERRAA